MAGSYGYLSLVTPAAADPVSVDEARDHCRLTTDDEDEQLAAWIKAATELGQKRTNKQFITATWKLTLDAFPAWEICLRRSPVQSVTSIVYVDDAGSSQTLSASLYRLVSTVDPPIIEPAYNQSWPATRQQAGAVEVTFVAGFGAASAVPARVKQAILLMVGHWYQNREAIIVGTISSETPFAADMLFESEWSAEY